MNEVFIREVIIARFFDFISVFWRNDEVFWIVLPLLVSTIGMQIYFGRNRAEHASWNDFFGISVVFTFVCASLLRFLYESYRIQEFTQSGIALNKLLVSVGFVIIGIFLMFGNFYHSFPPWLADKVSSFVFVNGLAVVAIIVVMGNMPFDNITIIVMIIFMILLSAVETLVKYTISPSPEAAKILAIEREKRRTNYLIWRNKFIETWKNGWKRCLKKMHF